MSSLVDKLEKIVEEWDRWASGRTCFVCGQEPCDRGPIPTAVACGRWHPRGTILIEREAPHEDTDEVVRKV
jgi:hypothetical protein